MQKKSSASFLILAISAFLNFEQASASETQLNEPCIHLISNAQFNEQKFLADRCRMIKNQAFSSGGDGFGSGQIHLAIHNTENFLYSIGTPIAFQMLKDLQNAGYYGYNAWCSKYGI